MLETDASVMILLCVVELRHTSRGIRTSSVFRREILGTKQTLTSWWVFHSDLCTCNIEGFYAGSLHSWQGLWTPSLPVQSHNAAAALQQEQLDQIQ